jgi:hypothetical protein
MKYSPLAVIAALTLASTVTSAQSALPLLAFSRSAGFNLGLSTFGVRSTNSAGGKFSYKGSVVIGGRFDQPLSRRTGLLIGLGLAPLSQQRGKGGGTVVLSEKLMVAIADAAIGFRFKPIAPIFFSGGGGITYATLPPANPASGSVSEPHILFAVGYDAPSSTRWNVRTVFTNRFVMVGDDNELSTTSESMAYDWTLEIGGRYRFGGRP